MELNNAIKFSSKYHKILVGIFELILAVPMLGFSIALFTGWAVLGWMIFLHIIGILLSLVAKRKISGHIVGIIGNMIAVIPFVGMISHAIIGLTLIYQGIKEQIDKPVTE